MPPNSQFMLLRRIAGYILAALAFFFMLRVLYTSQTELAARPVSFQLDPVQLVFALVLQVIGLSLSVETWRRLLEEMDGRIAFKDAFRIWFFSNLTRYIPGNIWQPATMAVLGEREGIPKSKTILSQALFILLTLSLAGVTSLSLAPLDEGVRTSLIVLCGCAVLFFTLPPVFRFVLGLIARVMHYEPMRSTPSVWRGLVPLFVAGAMWTAYGLSFYFFVRGLGVVGEPTWLTAIVVYAGAYLIGYVSLLTPSGMGIREGAMAFLLGAYLPTTTAVAIALLARLLSIAGELVCVGIAWLGTRT
jgi:glycosyltransferase 2 family protein